MLDSGGVVTPSSSTPQVILITGASRGIGAAVATQLADRDRHIIINFREKTRRAMDVADAICAAGGRASIAQADLCDESAARAMIDGIKRQFGRLDALVLNASGGMERGADPDYAMGINRDAQVGLTRRALELMTHGGRIVFVTSHQAHFYGEKPVPAEYLPVASSKRAGEDALRGLQDELAIKSVAFVVVSGDMIDGTITVRLLERSNPDAVAQRRAVAALPTIQEFANAIAAAVVAEPSRDGQSIYVGGPDYLR
jgi:NAD(P)-dependent dehydrogenase (short-subunit alcohol dehydrogenase family)